MGVLLYPPDRSKVSGRGHAPDNPASAQNSTALCACLQSMPSGSSRTDLPLGRRQGDPFHPDPWVMHALDTATRAVDSCRHSIRGHQTVLPSDLQKTTTSCSFPGSCGLFICCTERSTGRQAVSAGATVIARVAICFANTLVSKVLDPSSAVDGASSLSRSSSRFAR